VQQLRQISVKTAHNVRIPHRRSSQEPSRLVPNRTTGWPSQHRTASFEQGDKAAYEAFIHSITQSLTLGLDTDGRSEEIEKEKQESLKQQKEGKGNWKEGLASDSESIVRLPPLSNSPRF
jgi:hypothetical protein